MTSEKLQLTLYASGLKNVAGLGKVIYCLTDALNATVEIRINKFNLRLRIPQGTSDPFAIVTLLGSGPNEKPRVLGRTEGEKNYASI